MKTIGLIGGLTWVATTEYYQLINKKVNEISGAKHSAKCILYSVDFEYFFQLSLKGQWNIMLSEFEKISEKLIAAGAECILLCANTAHIVAAELQTKINVPLINIVEETAKEIKNQGKKNVALLGTRFTMENDFFANTLNKYNIGCVIPEKEDRDFINHTIFNELAFNNINPKSKIKFVEIIDKLINNGADGIILGCTELPLLVNQSESSAILFDTTQIHVRAAVNFAINKIN